MSKARIKRLIKEEAHKELAEHLEMYIDKVHIQDGDIVLVGSHEVMRALMDIKSNTLKPVPIILDLAGGGIKLLTRQQLIDALDRIDQIESMETV